MIFDLTQPRERPRSAAGRSRGPSLRTITMQARRNALPAEKSQPSVRPAIPLPCGQVSPTPRCLSSIKLWILPMLYGWFAGCGGAAPGGSAAGPAPGPAV